MLVDLSFFRYEIICIFWWSDEFKKWCQWYEGLERYFGDSLIANTVKVMPEWSWPFSSSKELLVEWFFSQTLYFGNITLERVSIVIGLRTSRFHCHRSEYDLFEWLKLNLEAARYIRHVRIIWFLSTKHTIWLLIPGTQFYTKYRPRVFYVLSWRIYYDRSVTPLDAARVNRTIFH